MKRRQFLKTISIIPLITTGAGTNTVIAQTSTREKKTTTIVLKKLPIAGFQFYQGENLWNQLKSGDTLKLSREPDNDYDENAIMIHWQNHHLGYIPRQDNTDLAQCMDAGEKLTAELVRLKQSDNPWNRIKIAIYQEITT